MWQKPWLKQTQQAQQAQLAQHAQVAGAVADQAQLESAAEALLQEELLDDGSAEWWDMDKGKGKGCKGFKGFKGKYGMSKGGKGCFGKGRRGGPSGPNLPRERVTQEPVTGEVAEWKGKYGWIVPTEPLDHALAQKHKGKLYVSMSDLMSGATELTPGSLCQFHVFQDASGLGAEEVLA